MVKTVVVVLILSVLLTESKRGCLRKLWLLQRTKTISCQTWRTSARSSMAGAHYRKTWRHELLSMLCVNLLAGTSWHWSWVTTTSQNRCWRSAWSDRWRTPCRCLQSMCIDRGTDILELACDVMYDLCCRVKDVARAQAERDLEIVRTFAEGDEIKRDDLQWWDLLYYRRIARQSAFAGFVRQTRSLNTKQHSWSFINLCRVFSYQPSDLTGYFEYDKVLERLFDICSTLFDLKFEVSVITL